MSRGSAAPWKKPARPQRSMASWRRSCKRCRSASTPWPRPRAWELLQLARIPIVISDWYMPEMDGPELCRRIRARTGEPYVYFILVTARGGKQQYLAGMEAGADDFIAKPVDPDELRARLKVAERILGLRKELEQLGGLLPICSDCQRIRNEKEEWKPLERYIDKHFERLVTHSICPDCYVTHVQPQLDRQERSP